MAYAPILVRAQNNQPFIATTDVSNTHIRGVLSQIQGDGTIKPLAYFSRRLNHTEEDTRLLIRKHSLSSLLVAITIITYGVPNFL